ncbi:MAG: ATP-binding cassette domain-containing protein [Thermodesulfobacteriota bacterium]
MSADSRKDSERGKGATLPRSSLGGAGQGLRAQGICVRRGQGVVLEEVDLELAPGEHVVLVGPNGSGKTTLLLTLKGALAPEHGRVTLGEGPIAPFDPRVGMVFANPEDQGVAPVVEDDVAFGLETRGLAPAQTRRRVEESLKAVGLWEERSALTHTLSGGQAQRLALAAVIALGARFLLLDEATSMLSPWDRDGLLRTVAELRGNGAGVLQVTHQGEEILWADRVVALAGGRVAFSGAPEAYFCWSGCQLPAPPYERARRRAAAEGKRLPSFPELAAWVAQ